jgi:hypothetical protein
MIHQQIVTCIVGVGTVSVFGKIETVKKRQLKNGTETGSNRNEEKRNSVSFFPFLYRKTETACFCFFNGCFNRYFRFFSFLGL